MHLGAPLADEIKSQLLRLPPRFEKSPFREPEPTVPGIEGCLGAVPKMVLER